MNKDANWDFVFNKGCYSGVRYDNKKEFTIKELSVELSLTHETIKHWIMYFNLETHKRARRGLPNTIIKGRSLWAIKEIIKYKGLGLKLNDISL